MKVAIACAAILASATGSLVAIPQAVAQQGGASKLPAYRINPGDEIEVYVWGEERLQRGIRVLPDGSFSFPLVGRVEAAGKLPSDIEAAITKGLAAQFRDQVPQVTVSVRNPTGFQFSVIGKVRSPGVFTPGKYVNVLEAVGMAGGPGEFADTSNVLILRKQNGSLVTMRVRLNDAIKGNPSSRDLAANGFPELQSGDTVIMP
jgi:polysaccharide export outer membrane protein